MSKSPGHEKWPDHKVEEVSLEERVKVEVDGHAVADSRQAIEVLEDGNPPRFYLPRSDVRMEQLEPSNTTTQCPFKGTAHYFHLNVAGRKFEDAVWTYENPFEEHQDLKDRLAFFDDRYPDIRVGMPV